MNLDFPPPQEQARVSAPAPATDASTGRPLWIWPFIAGASLALAGAAIAVAVIDDDSTDPRQAIEYSVEQSEPEAESDQDTVCSLEKKTLEIALEAWYAMNGTATDPTQDDLVSSGLMRDTINSYDFVRDSASSVEVVPVADGRCD